MVREYPHWRLALALLWVCVSMLYATSGRAQVSPGPLARAHQSLSGPLNCAKCHEFGSKEAGLKCLECHNEIRERVTERRGMHAVWLGPSATGSDCAACHSDHNGIDFPLIHWQPNRETMDHSKTGFPLTGRHAAISCDDCHKAENIPSSARPGIVLTNLNRTYLGLSRECLSCHADEHRGQLSANCASCHTTAAWKPAAGFDHAKTDFALTGAHATVACDKCHGNIADAKPYVRYVGLSYEKCTGCHADPHKGSFSSPCEACHITTTWTRVEQLAGFDHAKTNYPLLGEHRTVACSSCHKHDDFKSPVAHAKCTDCHNLDPHKGQFLARPSRGECAECHTVDGWKPSTFGVKEHATSAYPLLGKHSDVPCDKCHAPVSADTIYKVKFALCSDCHEDAHAGQFANARYANRCEDCHTVNDFRRSKFTISLHRDTRFPLEGAHATVPCTACHKVGAGERNDKVVPFHFQDQTCASCHEDPHHGEFRDQMVVAGVGGSPRGCAACHTVESWTDAKGFDHSKTAFPLFGAHSAAACSACHLIPSGAHTALFKGTPKECEVCHADVHGGQFAQSNNPRCDDCHNSERWVPSTFDHDARTSLPLTGGHAHVLCEVCHQQKQSIQGRLVKIYALASTKCADCHETPSFALAGKE